MRATIATAACTRLMVGATNISGRTRIVRSIYDRVQTLDNAGA
jgi:hypothetical protein